MNKGRVEICRKDEEGLTRLGAVVYGGFFKYKHDLYYHTWNSAYLVGDDEPSDVELKNDTMVQIVDVDIKYTLRKA